ncbi:TPA: ORF6C domain-containing protein [Clostridium botulinum]|nr:ORF6C domain-containing protein [Clostridium botulinum]HDK7182983.1 ORF6C domain-containing protein [Clostridium botulinum]HDK7186777.1 ORF6C domain-containing protein [Clostridium botulinum]HDK7193303.1 ORF6C domain-containing protein [Clostridium botulinum]HDK7205153.1 ORF6C domain-containing protein [Clostridium botulinum]
MEKINLIIENGQPIATEIKQSGLTLESREVAQMVEVEHSEILKKLEGTKKADGSIKQIGIIPTMTKGKIPVSNYFIQSTYKDCSGKENKCYLFTKMGCEFIANKFTGEKGIIFTAKYVEKFNKMEKQLTRPIKKVSAIDQLRLQYQVIEEHEEKLATIETKVNTLENNMVIEHGQEVTIKKMVDKQINKVCYGPESPAYLDKKLRGKIYRTLWRDYKGYFNITSYHDTLKKDFSTALDLIQSWRATGELLRDIQVLNNQINF